MPFICATHFLSLAAAITIQLKVFFHFHWEEYCLGSLTWMSLRSKIKTRIHLLTDWRWRPEYSMILICRSSKKFSKVHKRWVDSTDDVKTMHFSPPRFCRRSTKYIGLSFDSQICKDNMEFYDYRRKQWGAH